LVGPVGVFVLVGEGDALGDGLADGEGEGLAEGLGEGLGDGRGVALAAGDGLGSALAGELSLPARTTQAPTPMAAMAATTPRAAICFQAPGRHPLAASPGPPAPPMRDAPQTSQKSAPGVSGAPHEGQTPPEGAAPPDTGSGGGGGGDGGGGGGPTMCVGALPTSLADGGVKAPAPATGSTEPAPRERSTMWVSAVPRSVGGAGEPGLPAETAAPAAAAAIVAPQLVQKRASSGSSWPHRGQVI